MYFDRSEDIDVIRFAAVVLASTLMSGCVAVWGQSYHVSFRSPDSVQINYDRHFGSLDEITGVAQGICGEYSKNAAFQRESTNMWGITSASFACKARA